MPEARKDPINPIERFDLLKRNLMRRGREMDEFSGEKAALEARLAALTTKHLENGTEGPKEAVRFRAFLRVPSGPISDKAIADAVKLLEENVAASPLGDEVRLAIARFEV